MKKIYKIIVLSLVFTIALLTASTASAYDTFDIDTYLVFINVLDENILEIEEIIYADFDVESHGIIREIQTKGMFYHAYEDSYFETKYNAIISDIDVIGQPYTTSRNGNYQIIKIGDKDVYIDGMQKYHIKYTLDFGDDGIEAFDEFYFDVIGTEWSTYIHNVAVEITMPDEFDENMIGISTGYAGTSGTDIVKMRVDEEKIYLHTTEMLYPYEGMTVRIELPEGYFVGERMPTDWSTIFIYAAAALAAFVMLTWLVLGKDQKLYPTVEFYPPENLPPAEVGYIVDGKLDTKDVVSLLIYWADKGYLKIVEAKENDFYLVKLKPLDDNAEYYEQKFFLDLFKKRTKNQFNDLIDAVADNENLTDFHNYLLNKQKNNESLTYVRVKSLQNVFYTTLSSVKLKIRNKYSRKKGKRIYTSSSMFAKVLSFMMSPLPFFLGNLIIKSKTQLYLDDAVFGSIFWCILLLTVFIIVDQFVARRKSTQPKTKAVLTIIFAIILTVLAYISIIIIGDYKDGGIIAYIATGTTFIVAFFAMFMEKRNEKYNKLQEHILGLRMFLLNAEKDRIDRLVHDNPNYFFNVLSYAYVLGVTDQWAKQFEDIVTKQPDWYESSHMSRTYFVPSTFTKSFTNNINRMSSTMSSSPSSSGSSSGGYSGGGGFSGGGGGGGGGGSW